MNDAYFSDCRIWRYCLTRDVAPLTGDGTCAFIGLNPSTADEERDDPTIRRCTRFAHDWGYARLEMINLYAYCCTDPLRLDAAPDPIGPRNDQVISIVCGGSDLVVCAWGCHAEPVRAAAVLELVRDPHCLGLTKDGAPRHPLYVAANVRPVALSRSENRRVKSPLLGFPAIHSPSISIAQHLMQGSGTSSSCRGEDSNL